MSESGFEPLTDGFSIQYSTTELLRLKTKMALKLKSNIINIKIKYV